MLTHVKFLEPRSLAWSRMVAATPAETGRIVCVRWGFSCCVVMGSADGFFEVPVVGDSPTSYICLSITNETGAARPFQNIPLSMMICSKIIPFSDHKLFHLRAVVSLNPSIINHAVEKSNQSHRSHDTCLRLHGVVSGGKGWQISVEGGREHRQ